jgi:hypothetical protein
VGVQGQGTLCYYRWGCASTAAHAWSSRTASSWELGRFHNRAQTARCVMPQHHTCSVLHLQSCHSPGLASEEKLHIDVVSYPSHQLFVTASEQDTAGAAMWALWPASCSTKARNKARTGVAQTRFVRPAHGRETRIRRELRRKHTVVAVFTRGCGVFLGEVVPESARRAARRQYRIPVGGEGAQCLAFLRYSARAAGRADAFCGRF